MEKKRSTLQKKILILDDHLLVRQAIAALIDREQDLTVTRQLDTAEQLLESLDDLVSDLMIIDVSLPGMNGIELIKNVLFQKPDQKILVLSRHDEFTYAERALRAGAKGYVMKFEAADQLLNAIRKVLTGGLYVSDEIGEKLLLTAFQGKKESVSSPLEMLSDRELEVFESIGKGMSNRSIASKLHLSVKTVETYRSRIKDKLNFQNATELTFNAVKWMEEKS